VSGALRGIDRYKGEECVVVIGRNQPRVEDVEAMESAIFYNVREPIKCIEPDEKGEIRFPTEKRGYSLKNGTLVETDVEFHPDPRCDKILNQIRECETVQAVSRIRDIWQDNKTVYLLSDLVVDIQVDRLISWKDLKQGGTRFERMLDEVDFEHQVLPLSAEYCVKHFPNIWRSKGQYEKYMSREFKTDKILYNIYSCYSTGYTFKFSGNISVERQSRCCRIYR